MRETEPVPVLEVGGTHVTAALVDLAGRAPVGKTVRLPLSTHGSAVEILDCIGAAAAMVGAPAAARWGVAVPGPFDYARGIGLFRDVGKFDTLYGMDLGAELARRMRRAPAGLRFLNDADAFGIGEYLAGAAAGHRRAVCLTLRSGVGSAFLDGGVPVNEGPLVPPEGSAYLLRHRGRPLEETVSRRGIRTAYLRATAGDTGPAPDVRGIADRARRGDEHARFVLVDAFHSLGVTMAPWLEKFAATVLIVGGSIAASWDLVEEPLRRGLRTSSDAEPRVAERALDAPLLGAAWWSAQAVRTGEEAADRLQ
ncbi:ROK family protein [Amycolatopsis jiangsuensis]|uniref:Glucokinase n=1 Tax=Amycolatopsis jiangsuensis TaxID=1181879 RepID=A0A840J3X0_9PSEU|nr:ROK family protein [Amycolatopsis jiangsuensis]MBB4688760.1 glucokinase [Amycolatopsis jiangsuensis]